MNAVRSEVEELKEKIIKLEDTITHLQTENEILRANVAPEVLSELPSLSASALLTVAASAPSAVVPPQPTQNQMASAQPQPKM